MEVDELLTVSEWITHPSFCRLFPGRSLTYTQLFPAGRIQLTQTFFWCVLHLKRGEHQTATWFCQDRLEFMCENGLVLLFKLHHIVILSTHQCPERGFAVVDKYTCKHKCHFITTLKGAINHSANIYIVLINRKTWVKCFQRSEKTSISGEKRLLTHQ